MELNTRIKLIQMIDPYPIEPGTLGTVVKVTKFSDGEVMFEVKWDNGRHLGVIEGKDKYEIIE